MSDFETCEIETGAKIGEAWHVLFPGRKRPFETYFCSPGEAPPLHVARTSYDLIVIEGQGRQSEIQAREVSYSASDRPWENEDLFQKLAEFNSKHLPFRYWAWGMDSPDHLMTWWQESGKLQASFRLIALRDPEHWTITTIDPPLVGILGWTGPRPFGT